MLARKKMRGLPLLIIPILMTGTSTAQAENAVDSVVLRMEKFFKSSYPPPKDNRQDSALPQVEKDRLTLEQCLAIALRENLDLAGKHQSLIGKQFTETATFRKMLPTLSLSTSRSDILTYTSSDNRAEEYSTTLTLSQPIFRGKSLWGNWKKSELASQQAKMDVTRQVQKLIKDVKAAWYGILEKEQLLSSSKEALKRLHIHEENARAYFNVGRYWQNEVLQAQVEVAKGVQAVIEAENDLLLAESSLNRLLRQPLDNPIETDDKLEWVEMSGLTLEEAYRQARTNRQDLEKSYLDLKSNKWSEVTAGYTLLPQVDFTTTYNMSAGQASYHKYDGYTTATVSMSWDLWNWGQVSSEVLAAKATSKKSLLTYDDKIQSVLLEVREAYLNAKEADKKVQVLKKALQQSEENLKVNEIRYQQQLGSATDVLDALDLRTTTRDSYISSLSGYLTSLATLELAVGMSGNIAQSTH
jgi:outer membrane protein